ncbi:LPS-assembly protein LptD [Spongiibacter sp. KMU-158]|uniref:LPS-assembly protein LptD n=1 Tax=Spongiibacter pelagi TaxID=2760804 RepID=A0A927C238_9GAMM|nr:LPS-assembly protein LptD [Spongiibacter pelagi]MBD2858622.1 LPS-assembly protein LptD [Spongiibacter pelagi]
MLAFRFTPSVLLSCLIGLGISSPAFSQQNSTETDAPQSCNALNAGDIKVNYSALIPYYQHWFWVPDHVIKKQSDCSYSPGCRGSFVEPRRDWEGADLDPSIAPLEVSAQNIESLNESASMSGDVELRKGNLRLDAGYARYNRSNGQISLRDNVVLSQPGFILRGQSAELDTQNALGEMTQAEILSFETGARGTAGRIARPSYGEFLLEEASYTQCTPDNETWSLHAGNIKLDYETGRGVARDTTIKIHNIPVFYSPYLNFPIDDRRATGFLFPSLGLSDNRLDISLPYYFNLAPNYDLTLAPRYIETHGEALETRFRHLSRYAEWDLQTSYLPSDQQTNDNRWLVGLEENGHFDQRWSSSVDFNKVSDPDYFLDLGLSSVSVKRSTHLNQQASLQYFSENWRGLLEVQQYQTIAAVEDPYQKLPQLSLFYQSPTRNFQLEPELELEYSRFDHRDSYGKGGTKLTGQRLYSSIGASLPMRWRWGFIETGLRNRHVVYDLDDADLAGVDASPSTNSPQLTIDSGLFFERQLELGDQLFSQTLEPRLFYRYSEYQDQSQQPDFDSAALTFNFQQLFRDSRFTGHDRLDDANQLTAGLTSRFIDLDRGQEFLSVSLGQIFYFDDGRVQLPGDPIRKGSNSDVAGQVRLEANNNHSVSADILVDARHMDTNQSSISYHHNRDDGSLFNLGYTFRRAGNQFGGLDQDIKQLDGSLSYPINNQWKLFARSQYDLEEKRTMENLIGAEYQNCCWLTRVVFQQALEPDDNTGSNTNATTLNNAILVEFQLKGLGGLGTAVSNVLKESIFGYQTNE